MSDVVLEDHLIRVALEREGSEEIIEIEIDEEADLPAHVRKHCGIGIGVHLFERDCDEPLTGNVPGRRHLRLLAHPHRTIEVTVNYDHRHETRAFAPSATVFKVLQWAVGKHGYKLDPSIAAKANLILPGADQPLPRDRTIGSYTRHGEKCLVVDLTLKDFTNG